ncbi:ArsR/SmtB family transcription factor [Kordiimonas sp.]|uniref:ArsR/SmtB family transcription factor n=1 Tax=Kordiimonas sp. TaxID=1970157 RepID=UPI003A90ACA8
MNDDKAIGMLSALAQQTRFSVFRMLMRSGEAGMPAGKIAARLDIPQNTLSAHLSVLSNAGLVGARREGRSLIYSVRLNDTRDFMGYLVNDCCNGHPEICAISMTESKCSA